MFRAKNLAFTLIELLVVIVVVGILATISVATYADYQGKAKIAKLMSDYNQIETFFKQEALMKNNDRFYIDNVFTGADNPSMQDVINNSETAKAYFGSNLKAPLGDGVYFYDNDGDTFQCGVGGVPGLAYGVSIFIENVHVSDANKVLEAYGEGSDPLCGKVLFLALSGDYGVLGVRISNEWDL